MLQPGNRVRVKREIYRYDLHLNTGTEGTVLEVIYSGTGVGERIPYAKCLMDTGIIAALKISSVERVD